MPATSRSGERFSRRSGSGRAGSPSKSRITQPRSVEHRLAEVQVAVGADDAAAGADVRERLQLLAHVLAAAADRRRCAVGLGQLEEDPLDLLVDVGGEDRQRLRRSARRARTPGRRCPSRAPSAARRSPRRAPRSRSSSPSGSRAELVQRQLPAVARAGQELLQDARASRRSGGPRPRTSRPAAAMCGKPRADRKRSSSSSGFTPGSTRRNAFRISSSPKTIDELDCSTPTGRTSTVPPSAGARRLGAQRKTNVVLADLDLAVGAHPVQQLAARAPGRRARRRPSSRRPRRSRARPSPRRPAAARAAPGRSRASRSGSAPRPGQHEQRRLRRAAARASTISIVRDLARLGARTSAGRRPSRAAPARRGQREVGHVSHRLVLHELEPVEAARRQRQQVRQLADPREARAAEDLDRASSPRSAERSSSTACAERARLCTHSITSSS